MSEPRGKTDINAAKKMLDDLSAYRSARLVGDAIVGAIADHYGLTQEDVTPDEQVQSGCNPPGPASAKTT